MKSLLLSVAVLLLHVISFAAPFSTNSAYMVLYSQKTEITLKDTLPFTTTKYEIIFKFNDEKAITLYHDYSIYMSHFEKLEDLEVVTKNPQSDGKIKTIKQKEFKSNNAGSENVFYDDMQEYKINFLGLTVGSEAHITYTVTTPEAHFTDAMLFKHYLPVEKVFFELIVPDKVNVQFIEKNNPAALAKMTKEQKKNETVYTWVAEKVPEEKSFESAPGRLFYTPHILYKIDDYTIKGVTRSLTKTPTDLYRWYAYNIRDINKTPSTRIQQLADSICHNVKDDIGKAKRIYQWVQENIRYVAFEAGMEGLVPREADAICSKRYGDCKDMSNLQYNLLKAAGVKAYLVWIGSRRIPYTYTEVPLKNTDNHMIAAIRNGKDWIFLDATDPNCMFGMPADHIQGKEAMIGISPTEFELVMVPVVKASDNLITEKANLQLQGNDLYVKNTTRYNGLVAGNLANAMHYLTEKEKEDYAKGTIKRVGNNAVLKTFRMPKVSEVTTDDFYLEYHVPSYAREVGKEKYVNLFLDKMFMNDAIKEPDRDVPYGFKLNLASRSEVALEIPKGYKVSYTPPNASFSQVHFGFTVDYKQENGQLICTQYLYSDFPDLILSPSEFPQWNQFIKQLNLAYKESVILEQQP